MIKLFRFKYPKILFLVLTVVASYFIFSNGDIAQKIQSLGDIGYIGIYVAGLCFSFGFTTAFGIGYFITAEPNSLLLATVIGGLGALTGDLIIFKIVKASFMDEFERLQKTKSFRFFIKQSNSLISKKIKNYLLYAIAGIVIASPLPDEIGVAMLAGLTTIKPLKLSIISFIMNSLGIIVMLII